MTESFDAARFWDTLHVQPRFRPRYPNDHVVRFLFQCFPNPSSRMGRSALDIGVGGGRHTKLLCELGYSVAGVDISSEGLRHCADWLVAAGQTATLREGSMTELPFPDEAFDLVISYGVLNYTNKRGMARAAAELFRVLVPRGRALVVTRTSDDYRAGKGTSIESGTYCIEIEDTNEQGTMQRFLDERGARELFASFSEVGLEKTETTFKNLSAVNSDWLIQLTR